MQLPSMSLEMRWNSNYSMMCTIIPTTLHSNVHLYIRLRASSVGGYVGLLLRRDCLNMMNNVEPWSIRFVKLQVHWRCDVEAKCKVGANNALNFEMSVRKALIVLKIDLKVKVSGLGKLRHVALELPDNLKQKSQPNISTCPPQNPWEKQHVWITV